MLLGSFTSIFLWEGMEERDGNRRACASQPFVFHFHEDI